MKRFWEMFFKPAEPRLPDPMTPPEPVVVNISEINRTAPAPDSVRFPMFESASSVGDDASTRPGPSWTTTRPNSSEESETEEIHHCSSAFLASRLRKIAPSIRFDNRRSSIEFSSKFSRRNCIFVAKQKEKQKRINPTKEKTNIPLGRKQSKNNDSKEDKFVENSNQALLIEESDEIDDEELKFFPVPLCEKRNYRMSLRIPTVSWKQRMAVKLHFIWQVIKKIFHFNLWNHHLKLIESRRGASVASYFLFIRWLLFMNLVILLLNLTFLVIPHATSHRFKREPKIPKAPEVHYLERDTTTVLDYTDIYEKLYINRSIADDNFYNNEVAELISSEASSNRRNLSETRIITICSRKYIKMTKYYKRASFIDYIQHFLQGTGALESSLLFLGHYPRSAVSFLGFNINVPMAFVLLFIVFMVISLIMMLKYSSYGIKEAFLTKKSFMNFTNDVLCAWDYCIQDVKAAELHRQSFYLQLRSSLFEVRQNKEILERSRMTRTKLLTIRIFINVVITGWIALCYLIIIQTLFFQMEAQKNLSTSGLYPMFIQFLLPGVLFIIRKPSMILFNSIVLHEKYTSQVRVNISIYRNAFLNLSSIAVFIITLKNNISCEPKDICGAGIGNECKAPMCWETYVGQQFYKLALAQLIIEPIVLLINIPQDILVRKYDNKFTRMWGQPVFLLHFEVLWPIYAQTLLWLGVFQSPLLPCITISYLVLLFYIQKSIILNHSSLPSIPFKASRFNSTFMNILMICFLIVTMSDVYTLINLSPSPGCGPFRRYESMIKAIRESFKMSFFDFTLVWDFIFSAWFFIPVTLFECAIIYYYWKYKSFLNRYEEQLKAELYLMAKDNQFLLDKVKLKKNS